MKHTPRGEQGRAAPAPDLFLASRPLETVVVRRSGKWIGRAFVALPPGEARLACVALNEYDPGWFAVRPANEVERAWRDALDDGVPPVGLVGQA